MGIKSPFGYVDNERKMLGTMLNLLENFCLTCHTNADWGNCHKCPVGHLMDECKDYIRTAINDNPYDFSGENIKSTLVLWDEVPKADYKYYKIFDALQDEIKDFYWSPLEYHYGDYKIFFLRYAQLCYWWDKKYKKIRKRLDKYNLDESM